MATVVEQAGGLVQDQFEQAEVASKVWRCLGKAKPQADRPLPRPTRSVDDLIADLDSHGYCFVAEALPLDVVAEMKNRLDEQIEGERSIGRGLLPATNDERISNLLNKGAVFAKVVADPLVDTLLSHLLDDAFLLGLVGAVKTLPGSLAQGLHIDQAYMGFPTPVPVAANTVWMLDDFTDENGGTRVVPGSHLWSPEAVEAHHEHLGVAAGDGLENPPGTIAAQAPAGSCMVFDARILHGTGRNRTTDVIRRGIFCYYGRGYMRQFENPFLSIDDDVMMSLDPEVRCQLGYRPWFYFGGCEMSGLAAPLDVVRPVSRVGVLKP